MNDELKEQKSYIENSTFVAGASLLGAVIGYVFNPLIIAPRLGPEGIAVLGAFLFLNFALSFPQRPIILTLSRFVAHYGAKGHHGKVATVAVRSLRNVALYTFFASFIMVGASPWVAAYLNLTDTIPVIAAIVLAYVGLLLSATQGILQGLMRFKRFGAILLADPLLRLGIGATMVLSGFGVVGAMAGYVGGYCASTLLGLFFMRDIFRHKDRREPVDAGEMYVYSIPIWLYSGYLAFAFSIDGLLAKHYFTDVEAGIYVAASTLAKMIFVVVLPISMVCFAAMSDRVARGLTVHGIFWRTISYTIGVCLLAILGSFICSPLVISVTYGEQFLPAAKILAFACISFTPLAVNMICISYYLAHKRSGFVYGLLCGCVIHYALMQMYHSTLTVLIFASLAGGVTEWALSFLTDRLEKKKPKP